MSEIAHEDLAKLTEKIHSERAVDFRGYKPSSLSRRIQRRMDAVKCADVNSYIEYLDRRPDEYAKLIDCILINVTEFFRDPEAWQVITEEIIPRILSEKRPGNSIRVWSAGCATGEEVYSIAMALAEGLGARINEYDVRIYATDMDDDALQVARRAEYSEDSVKSIPPELLKNYFVRNGRWTVNKDLRRLVIFGRHNLATDAPISHVDLILCRNVLIYMTVELQNRLLSKFHYAAEPNGFLFLGKAESLLSASRTFAAVNERWRIFRKESAMAYAARAAAEQSTVGRASEEGLTEYQWISEFNNSVLRHAPSAIVAVDNNDIIKLVNSAAESFWGLHARDLLGKSITEISGSPSFQELLPKISQARSRRREVVMEEVDLTDERGKPFQISVSVGPMLDVRGGNLGVVVVAENITTQIRLRSEVEAAIEQLQATNEEMETTNEELQSTNEELETTNEELQSTNEELETTNEELQSTNEELGATNAELSVRTTDLNTLSLYHDSILTSIEVPIVALDEANAVTTWNPAAEKFYGLKNDEAIRRNFFELALPGRVAKTREKLRDMKETRESYRSEPMPYTASTGKRRTVVMEYEPLLDIHGRYKGAILIVRDAKLQPIEPARP